MFKGVKCQFKKINSKENKDGYLANLPVTMFLRKADEQSAQWFYG